MDAMDVTSSDEEVEEINFNKENKDVAATSLFENNVVTQTDLNSDESGCSPINTVPSRQSTNHDVQEELQVKLQIGNKSNPKIVNDVGVHKTASAFNRGDGASVLNAHKTDATASTSKVATKRRVKGPRIHDVLRPTLPRKSKDRAKMLLKAIARGIIIPRARLIRPRRAPKQDVKRIRFGRKRQVPKKSLMTVWRRTRRDRSADSRLSELCSCGHCDCNWSAYY